MLREHCRKPLRCWVVLGTLLLMHAKAHAAAESESAEPTGLRIPGRPTVNGMVAIFGYPDWKMNDGTSSCIQQVNRIAQRLGVAPRSSIKFATYFFYTWALPEDQQPGEDFYYRHNVTKWLARDSSYHQVEPTPDLVASYISDFSACLAQAVSLGFTRLYITPMVDADYNQRNDTVENGRCCPWRNAAEFDPIKILPGSNGYPWSYETLAVQPSLTAIQRAIANRRDIIVSVGLGAELGRSYTKFGDKWAQLATSVQTTLNTGARLQAAVGPNFDWGQLCGTLCGKYSTATKVTDFEWANFRLFLSRSNMFGVSSYPNVWDQYDPVTRTLDVSHAIRTLDNQLTQFAGTSIQEQRSQRKIFILNELGVGGCLNYGCDGKSTPDIYQLSKNSFNGQPTFAGYGGSSTTKDDIVDPFRWSWSKAYRMEWYRQNLAFFRDIRNPYAPDQAFIWGLGSWGIMANYPPDSFGQDPDGVGCDPQKSYCDPDLLAMLNTFNQLTRQPTTAQFNLPGAKYYDSSAVQVLSVRALAVPEDFCKDVPPEFKPVVCSGVHPIYY